MARTGTLPSLKKQVNESHQQPTPVPVPVRIQVPVMGRPPRPEEMPRPLMMVQAPPRFHRPLMKAAPGAFSRADIHAELTRLLWCAVFVLAAVLLLVRAVAG